MKILLTLLLAVSAVASPAAVVMARCPVVCRPVVVSRPAVYARPVTGRFGATESYPGINRVMPVVVPFNAGHNAKTEEVDGGDDDDGKVSVVKYTDDQLRPRISLKTSFNDHPYIMWSVVGFACFFFVAFVALFVRVVLL